MLRVDIDAHIKSNHRVRKVNLIFLCVCVSVCVTDGQHSAADCVESCPRACLLNVRHPSAPPQKKGEK